MNYPYASAQGAKRASKSPLLATAGHVTRKQRDTRRKTRQLEPKGNAERIAMRGALSWYARVDGRHQRPGLPNCAAFADEIAFCIGSLGANRARRFSEMHSRTKKRCGSLSGQWRGQLGITRKQEER
jgi:hypothetical protein